MGPPAGSGPWPWDAPRPGLLAAPPRRGPWPGLPTGLTRRRACARGRPRSRAGGAAGPRPHPPGDWSPARLPCLRCGCRLGGARTWPRPPRRAALTGVPWPPPSRRAPVDGGEVGVGACPSARPGVGGTGLALNSAGRCRSAGPTAVSTRRLCVQGELGVPSTPPVSWGQRGTRRLDCLVRDDLALRGRWPRARGSLPTPREGRGVDAQTRSHRSRSQKIILSAFLHI